MTTTTDFEAEVAKLAGAAVKGAATEAVQAATTVKASGILSKAATAATGLLKRAEPALSLAGGALSHLSGLASLALRGVPGFGYVQIAWDVLSSRGGRIALAVAGSGLALTVAYARGYHAAHVADVAAIEASNAKVAADQAAAAKTIEDAGARRKAAYEKKVAAINADLDRLGIQHLADETRLTGIAKINAELAGKVKDLSHARAKPSDAGACLTRDQLEQLRELAGH